METATGQMDRSGAKRDGGGVVRGSCRLMSYCIFVRSLILGATAIVGVGRSLFDDCHCLGVAS